MELQLDGADIAQTATLLTPPPRKLTSEVGQVSVRTPINWTQTAHEQSAALRRERIAVDAYYRFEARGFAPGHDAADWLLAQAEVDFQDARSFET